jgi:hypothetical protein
MLVKLPPARPADDFVAPKDLSDTSRTDVRYTRSYLLIRIVVGLLGLALPIFFIIGEASIARSVHFRGSISAYYHSPMRDIFVGGLCVIGFLLIMYLAGQGRDNRSDRRLSTWAGIALLAVVFFPTTRPGVPDGAPLCGDTPDPLPGCSTLQHQLGETPVAFVHYTAASLFVVFLACICFYWARRDVHDRMEAAKARGETVSRSALWRTGRARVHAICGSLIVLGLVWVALRIDIWELTPLYVGELIAVWSFGVAWLFSAGALLKQWRELLPIASPPKPAEAAEAAA